MGPASKVNFDFVAPATWVALWWEGTYSNNIESNEGAGVWRPPSRRGPCLPRDYCARRTCMWGPLIVVGRPDGRDFLHRRISEMKSSANPATCAPGSHGPPAYCDSLRSASFSRTLQLILGQPISLLLQPNVSFDCLCDLNCSIRLYVSSTWAKLRTRHCTQTITVNHFCFVFPSGNDLANLLPQTSHINCGNLRCTPNKFEGFLFGGGGQFSGVFPRFV